jgi:hypothetical protein
MFALLLASIAVNTTALLYAGSRYEIKIFKSKKKNNE